MSGGPEFGKTLILIGLIVAGVGVFLAFGPRILWSRIPLGRLPGDILIDRPGFKFYFPLTTGIVISLAVSLLLYLFRK